MKDIHIHPVLNGFIVTVGCQQIVYNNRHVLVSDLAEYFADPKATEERILKESINRDHTMPTRLLERGALVAGGVGSMAERAFSNSTDQSEDVPKSAEVCAR